MAQDTRSRTSRTIGQIPGSLVHVGREHAREVKIELLEYAADSAARREMEIKELLPPLQKNSVHWYNLDGIHDAKVMKHIRDAFDIHPLVMEDIMNAHHRPKSEFFDEYFFFTLKMLSKSSKGGIRKEQVSFLLGPNYVISFQERPGDIFDPIRERILEGKGRVRDKGPQYLVYLLLDIVIDNYLILTDYLGDRMSALERNLMDGDTTGDMEQIQTMKRDLLFVKRSLDPLIEAIRRLESECNDESVRYFRDLLDHVLHERDSISLHWEMLGSLTDLHYSMQSNKMNEVMKVLTIIATIFIPLSFLAGVYGMNFEHMPETKFEWAYPVFWILILLIGGGMLIYFRRKKWF